LKCARAEHGECIDDRDMEFERKIEAVFTPDKLQLYNQLVAKPKIPSLVETQINCQHHVKLPLLED